MFLRINFFIDTNLPTFQNQINMVSISIVDYHSNNADPTLKMKQNP